MPTTIQVTEETLELLKRMRKAADASSYDELIQTVIKKTTTAHESLYGLLGKKTMKDILRGLRDEHDRL